MSMKRRDFLLGASAAVAATAVGLPGIASAAPELADGVLFTSPPCVGYSKAGAWVGRSVVLQVGDGLGNWKTVENLKTLVLDTKELA